MTGPHDAPGVRIARTDVGGAVVLASAGSLDAATAPGWQNTVVALVENLPAGRGVILDLRELRFIAVAGIRAIVAVADFHPHRSTVAVLDDDHYLRVWLSRIDADRRVRLASTVDDAVAIDAGTRP